MNAILAVLALTVGNFLFQWFQVDPNWIAALERSWFQAWAIGFYAVIWR